jgi:patatin-related protein
MSTPVNNENPDYGNDLTQEIRLAVVMYGGVSLAIYMNGISQELLHVVRATAPKQSADAQTPPLGKLTSTEPVYEKIGKILYHGRKPEKEKLGDKELETTNVRTRVLIDILSGTSAGGINAVFLAKALANEQNLDSVKQTWMQEGDIDTLLNDKKSQQGRYGVDDAQTNSLLNSQRMYGKLLEAFDEMDAYARKAPGFKSRLATEIDLFVTTTDLNGLVVPIALANTVIQERDHKGHFQFTYGPSRLGEPNDFLQPFNPMLAFAARCTSSFPVAFEPMFAERVNDFVPDFTSRLLSPGQNPDLSRFFTEVNRFGGKLTFVLRPFADGGYLNNKPFNYATQAIRQRRADYPVVRKLLYLDPFPELSSELDREESDFTFTENLIMAGSTLPRYQTIREEIERVNAENRRIRRANLLRQEIEKDLPNFTRQCLGNLASRSKTHFEKLNLLALTEQHGPSYVAYHRLCVSRVTDDLALLFTRLFGFKDDSDEMYAIRMLAFAWRAENYSSSGGDGKETENQFLYAFDLLYRLRRFQFVISEIDRLLAICGSVEGPKEQGQERQQELLSVLREAEGSVEAANVDISAARARLKPLRKLAGEVTEKLAQRREELWLRYDGQHLEAAAAQRRAELIQALAASRLTTDDLRWILTPLEDQESQDRATRLYEKGIRDDLNDKPRPIRSAFKATANLLKTRIGEDLRTASDDFLNEINPGGKAGEKDSAKARENGPDKTLVIERFLWVRFMYFECRDVIVYPLMGDMGGEGCPTEIYRIGPQDATFVYGEAQGGDARRAKKLAGTALMDFGAFLDSKWRANDMLWGRLDGAERIIESLLPDEADQDLRKELTQQATEIILKEEFAPKDGEDLERDVKGILQAGLQEFALATIKKDVGTSENLGALAECKAKLAAAEAKAREARIETVENFLNAASAMLAKESPKLADVLLRLAKDDQRLELFRAYYSRPSGPPLETSVGWAKRATAILGEMFRGLDQSEGINTKVGQWIGRAGTFGANLVHFALPDTLLHKMTWHWLGMIYLAEAILIVVGGFVYKGSGLETAGWIALLLTLAAHFVASWIGRWLSMRPSPPVLLIGLLIVGIAMGLGILHYQFFWSWHDLMCPLTKIREWVLACCKQQ